MAAKAAKRLVFIHGRGRYDAGRLHVDELACSSPFENKKSNPNVVGGRSLANGDGDS